MQTPLCSYYHLLRVNMKEMLKTFLVGAGTQEGLETVEF